jgi:hypothetical protein
MLNTAWQGLQRGKEANSMNTNVSKVLLVFAIMFCANLVFAQNQIEFDGGYINTQKGKYLEMQTSLFQPILRHKKWTFET